MTTSPTHFLSKPAGRDPIDPSALAYFRQRNRGHAYNLVIDEFEKSGMSQADLAVRLHKGTDQISRWLGSPGNWGLDTLSDLLFGISGAEPAYAANYPLDLCATNYNSPEWMTSSVHSGYIITFPDGQLMGGRIAASLQVLTGGEKNMTFLTHWSNRVISNNINYVRASFGG